LYLKDIALIVQEVLSWDQLDENGLLGNFSLKTYPGFKALAKRNIVKRMERVSCDSDPWMRRGNELLKEVAASASTVPVESAPHDLSSLISNKTLAYNLDDPAIQTS
jgi:hypothetical protein